jgi:hypothetical protein
MFEIKFISNSNTRLITKLRGLSPRIRAALSVKMTKLMYMLASKIAAEKLSGQTLRVRTGTLRSSVHADPIVTAGNTIRGSVSMAEGPSFYGRFHETGVPHSWTVMAMKGRALQFLRGPKTVYAQNIIHPPLKQRAFARPSLLESAQTIHNELQRAIDQEIGRD